MRRYCVYLSEEHKNRTSLGEVFREAGIDFTTNDNSVWATSMPLSAQDRKALRRTGKVCIEPLLIN